MVVILKLKRLGTSNQREVRIRNSKVAPIWVPGDTVTAVPPVSQCTGKSYHGPCYTLPIQGAYRSADIDWQGLEDAEKPCSHSPTRKGVSLARSKAMISHMDSGNAVCEGDGQATEGGITSLLESSLTCCYYYIKTFFFKCHLIFCCIGEKKPF